MTNKINKNKDNTCYKHISDLYTGKYTKMELQWMYINEHNLPNFMPSDGKCLCSNHIVDDYTEEECANTLIGRCKKCNRSLSV